MSSGEVLFILAFIVLPTAILVSSVWAVIFVRRRPDRIYQEPDTVAEPLIADTDASQDQTAVLPAMPVQAAQDEDDLPVTEHDVIVITDEEPIVDASDEQVDEAAVVEADYLKDDTAPADPVEDEMPVLQSTEDLDDVVKTLRELDHVATTEEPVEETEEPPMATAEDIEVDEPEEETFSETSELPTIEKPVESQPQETGETTPEPEPAEPEAAEPVNSSRWRRRKQSVKLRPGDPDAPRARGRNREPHRQVPQIVRPSRRRDDISPTPPPDTDPDADSTTTRD